MEKSLEVMRTFVMTHPARSMIGAFACSVPLWFLGNPLAACFAFAAGAYWIERGFADIEPGNQQKRETHDIRALFLLFCSGCSLLSPFFGLVMFLFGLAVLSRREQVHAGHYVLGGSVVPKEERESEQ